jgi:SAM-dependent methyltransferase
MRLPRRLPFLVRLRLPRVAVVWLACCAALAALEPSASRRITWEDLAPLHDGLAAHALTAASFPAFLERTHASNAQRVREGDLDHLVFYLLQSAHFTERPPIEPALSARTVVESLAPRDQAVFLRDPTAVAVDIPSAVRARIADLLRAIDRPNRDARLTYFHSLLATTFPDARQWPSDVAHEYLRAMRFLYEKEFVAQHAERPAEAVAELYRSRGLSTDTAVEAGYAVYTGLGVVASLEPARRIRRVLIVGPGLDLAPRTALHEEGAPESYQPWAVMDALVSLGLSRLDDLAIVGADINPRVVQHLQRSRTEPPTLTLASEIRETDTVTLAKEYRDYFAHLGEAIGAPAAAHAGPRSSGAAAGKARLQKTIRVSPAAAHVLDAVPLDIVTDRLEGEPFDLIIATNILPYFDDVQLMLVLSNVASMLRPGGIFLHNEARTSLGDMSAAVGLAFQQSRHVTIADVRGAPAPLFDSVWLHVRDARR